MKRNNFFVIISLFLSILFIGCVNTQTPGSNDWRDIENVDDFIGRWEGIHYFYSKDKNNPIVILRAILEYKKNSDRITFVLTLDLIDY
jgi:hypothetical protein